MQTILPNTGIFSWPNTGCFDEECEKTRLCCKSRGQTYSPVVCTRREGLPGYHLLTLCHYNDVIMGVMASQITILTIVCSSVYSGADQRKHQSSASLALCVRGIHRSPVNSPHKWPVTRKIFPFDDVIMFYRYDYHIREMSKKMSKMALFSLLFYSQRGIKLSETRLKWIDTETLMIGAHSDVVGASPADAAPTTSSFST